jgi:hypothetical protein
VPNNPAALLLTLVRRLRFTSSSGPPARVWAHALDIPLNRAMTGPSLVQVVQGILAFLDLVDETETGLRELKFDDFYAEALPPLRQVAQRSLSNLRANQSNLTRPITDETLTLLRVIAAEWEKKKPDPKNLWARFYKVSVKLFEIVKFASDTRKTIEAVSPIVRLIGAPDEIPPVDLNGPNKQ